MGVDVLLGCSLLRPPDSAVFPMNHTNQSEDLRFVSKATNTQKSVGVSVFTHTKQGENVTTAFQIFDQLRGLITEQERI